MYPIASLALLAVSSVSSPPAANVLARFPNSDGHSIVFSARGHLWTVPLAGGDAHQLTSGTGYETAPRFSPDGRWIAFTDDHGGQQDVYVMPSNGGVPRRLTWLSVASPSNGVRRPSQEGLVVAWTPDSRGIVFLSRRQAWNSWQYRPFTVSLNGSEPVPLPVDRSGYLSFGPDGHSFALNRTFSDFRTWKRYTGGLQQDVEIYDPKTRRLDRITDWKGNDSIPMWVGDRIYFLSDRDAQRRVNLWAYDLRTHATRQVTHFADYDIDIPSYGGGVISFQEGGHLWALDVATEKLRSVAIAVSDDGSHTAPRTVPVKSLVRDEDTDYDTDYRLSPNGEAAAFVARGDIFVVPMNGKAPRNLTATSNAEEDHPAWSPDGRWMAYTTDASGEQQVAVRLAAGGPERQLTHFTSGFLYQPTWSPDSRFIAIHDAAHRLWLVPTQGGVPREVAYNRDHYMHETDEHDVVFSPDGRWLAFSTSRPTRLRALHLYEIANGHDTVVSSPDESDYRPAFSPDGKYIYFVSDRHAISVQADRETNAVTVKSGGIYVAALATGTPPRFQPQGDGLSSANQVPPAQPRVPVPVEANRRRPESTAPSVIPKTDPTPAGPAHVDLDGLMARAVPVPVAPMKIVAMEVHGDAIFYRTQPPDTLTGSLPGEQSELHRFDFDGARDESVVNDLDSHVISADGRHVLYETDDHWTIADATSGHPHATNVDLSGLVARIDPREEWHEMFENSWRLERDLFVNANMNGNNWQAVHDAYARLLPLVGTRDDLNYLIGQVIGEIGSSHTYVGGGDDGQVPAKASTPRLGADFTLAPLSGRYQIARIYPGDSTRSSERGPLGWPGLNVHEGDYLLAIDGHELVAPSTPEALLEGTHGTVTLTLATTLSGTRRTVSVMPIQSEYAVRQLAWVQRNRALVDRLSGGRIGYIYMADMQNLGMEEFVHEFYAQLGKQALVIDVRWNGGGNVDQIVLERLRRTLSSMQTQRDRVPQTQPDQIQVGPKDMLVNHFSASDGDVFPYHFRAYGLGKLVGTRTWGGVRGVRTFWTLLDGGYVTVPEITFSGLDGHWALENVGNQPDIEVEDKPWEEAAGSDLQIEATVRDLLHQLPTRRGPPPVASDTPIYAPGGETPPSHVGSAAHDSGTH